MGLQLPIARGGRLTQEFGPSRLSVEPSMWYSANRKAYWNPYPGARFSDNVHAGTDWAAPIGTQLLAMEAGTVVRSEFDKYNGGGWVIAVEIRPNTKYSFNHCEKLLFKVGAKVTKGQPIATLGCTGTIWTGSTFIPSCYGAHVHVNLEIRERGADGVTRTMMYNPKHFLDGGPKAADKRVQPVKR